MKVRTMRAIRFHQFGGPENLIEEEIPKPVPSRNQVMVRLAATSVNPVDFKIRERQVPYVDESKLPYVGGRDIAGWIEKLGGDVSGLAIGDAVYGLPSFDYGTFAEYCVASANSVAPAPENITIAEAAAVPLAGLTAWQGLTRHGMLQAGQRILIHGGAGGTGHFAVQFAKALGATVAVTASSRDMEFLHKLGAETVVDYRQGRFEDLGEQFDLVLDLVGGPVFDRSWSVLKPGGRLVSALRLVDGNELEFNGRVGIRYFTEPEREDLVAIAALIDQRQIKIEVSQTYPLAQVAMAQTQLQKGGVRGKLLISIAG